MPLRLLDRIGVHAVGKHQKFLAWIAALLLPPPDDLLACRDRRQAVRAEAGPVRHPLRRVAQESLGAEGVGQGDQQVASIGVPPLVEDAIGRPAERVVVIGERGRDHGQFMRVGANGFEIVVHRQQNIRRAGEGGPQCFLGGFHAPALPEKAMTPPRSEVRQPQVVELAQSFEFAPQLCLGARIQHIEREPALTPGHLARPQLVENGERRNLPHRGVGPSPMEMQLVLAIDFPQFVFRKPERREPIDKVRREHLGLAVERVAREPDQLLFTEGDAAGMVELRPQFTFVDDLGKPDVAAAINDGKRDMLVRIEFPDHLQHEQLVEIGIEQAAHDRIEAEAVVIGSRRDIRNGHAVNYRADA